MGQLLDESATLSGDYLAGLSSAALALLAVAGVAFAVLRFAALRGALGPRGKLLGVEESLRLDPRNQLVIVRVEGRRLLIATHSDATARLLAELSPGSPGALETAAPDGP
jgi:flagellar biogenesis protein FliO